MRSEEIELTLSEVISARVTPSEYKALKERAALSGKRLSDWARETLCSSVAMPPGAYSQLAFQTVSTEILRLTLVAAQSNEDISSRDVQERIEKQARASADIITDRRLHQVTASRGAA